MVVLVFVQLVFITYGPQKLEDTTIDTQLHLFKVLDYVKCTKETRQVSLRTLKKVKI